VVISEMIMVVYWYSNLYTKFKVHPPA
jgi:hypothetical protein